MLEQQVAIEFTQIIDRTHRFLSDNLIQLPQDRQLSQKQHSILQKLDQNSIQYHQITGVLAIQTYSKYIFKLLQDCQPIVQMTSLLFQSLSSLRQWLDTKQSQYHLEQCWATVTKLSQLCAKIFPDSPMLNAHQKFIQQNQDIQTSSIIYNRLYEQNLQLKSKLQHTDKQLLDLQLKFTRSARDVQSSEDVDMAKNLLQLRQKLAAKEQQIQQMNQQFSAEINKYNVVYESMKKQIFQLKDYKQADLIQIVQNLQTEIVRLRQQKERDQIIIQDLKNKIGSTYYLPQSGRRSPTYSRLYY